MIFQRHVVRARRSVVHYGDENTKFNYRGRTPGHQGNRKVGFNREDSYVLTCAIRLDPVTYCQGHSVSSGLCIHGSYDGPHVGPAVSENPRVRRDATRWARALSVEGYRLALPDKRRIGRGSKAGL